MRIRLLQPVAGALGSPVSGSAGDELDVPDDVARVWVDGERAEAVDADDSPTSGRRRRRERVEHAVTL